jgi:hypothetical protein
MSDREPNNHPSIYGKEDKIDNSLQGQSKKRALSGSVPTTLTPHEWEQWYQEHGVPPGHRKPDSQPRPGRKQKWWRWW